MKVREIMDKEPLIIHPETILLEVMERLKEKEVGFVWDGERYYGGIARLEILKKRINLQEMKAKSVAIKTPKLSPEDDIFKVSRAMIDSNFYYLPVFEDKKLIGEVSYWSVLKAGKDVLKEYKVKEVMTKDVIYINGKDSVGKAIAIMRKERISHLPVVEKGKVLGILTARDIILRVIAPRDRQRYGDFAGEKVIPINTPVSDIVEPVKPVVTPNDDLSSVVDLMKDQNFTACLVMDGGEIVGIITRKDLLEILSEKYVKEDFYVMISSNFPLEREYVMYYAEKIWRKFSKFLNWGRMFVYVKREGREPNFRYIVRIRLRSHPGAWISKSENYLLEMALKEAFERLEVEILKDKEEFLNRPEIVEL